MAHTIDEIYDLLTDGTGTVAFKNLVINNGAGDAVSITSNGGNAISIVAGLMNGIDISANNIGMNILSSANGLVIQAAGTAAIVSSTLNGAGLIISGSDDGAHPYSGLQIQGSGTNGTGVHIEGGGTTGTGVSIEGGTSGKGIYSKETEIIQAMAAGKFTKDFPNPGDWTFYADDNVTVLFVVHTDNVTGRTRIA